jgi:hypothetical protein
VFNRIKNVLFKFDVFVLLIIDDNIFTDAFHGINIPCVHVLYKIDFSEGALADHLHNNEILQLHTVALFLPLENECTALFHAGTGTGLLNAKCDLLLLFFIIIVLLVIVVVLILVLEVLALLELLVADLNILLQVIQLISSIIDFGLFLGFTGTEGST